MTRPLAILRPEPGNAATAARVEALGLATIRLPLFAVRSLPWQAPTPARYDALLLTSANAARLAGPALATLASLPVLAVGAATADAARAVGLTIRLVGNTDAAGLLADARAAGTARALHLGGRETGVTGIAGVADSIAVYATDPVAIAPTDLARLTGSVVLLHSPRAALQLAVLVGTRARVRLAALSPAVAAAAGTGWEQVAIAGAPSDAALIAAAQTLAG